MAKSNHPSQWLSHFPWKKGALHKYQAGHVLAVAGRSYYIGAPKLAAIAALRLSGMVTLVVPEERLPLYTGAPYALILSPYTKPEELLIKKASVAVFGMGAGVSEHTEAVLAQLIASDLAVVLDADALTTIAHKKSYWFDRIKDRNAPTIITPHEGEFSRLFGQVEAGLKLELTQEAAQLSGAVVVHKGAHTVMADPVGRVLEQRDAPATLATAGAGDVLAGMIAGLLAGGMPPLEAASAANWLHALAARTVGDGLIADDLLAAMPHALSQLKCLQPEA